MRYSADVSERLWSELHRITDALLEAGREPGNGLEWVAALDQLSLSLGVDLADVLRIGRRYRFFMLSVDIRTDRGWISTDDLSAGQLLLLSSIARVCANIVTDSLVLIDEPEIGLHPTWQSSFIPLLRECLPRELGGHYFLATHSPHLVADADDVLVPADVWGHFVEYTDSHTGRSVENLLYRAFGARVTGNSNVERDLLLLTQFYSDAHRDFETDEVTAAIRRLRSISGVDTPVINRVVLQVEEQLRGSQ